jgi:hypothetical protein
MQLRDFDTSGLLVVGGSIFYSTGIFKFLETIQFSRAIFKQNLK